MNIRKFNCRVLLACSVLFVAVLVTGCQSDESDEKGKSGAKTETSLKTSPKKDSQSSEKDSKATSQKSETKSTNKMDGSTDGIASGSTGIGNGQTQDKIAKNPLKKTESQEEIDPIDAAIEKVNSQEIEELVEPEPIPTPDTFKPEKHWVRLLEGKPLWIDKKNGRVIADGFICQNKAPLEMLAFPYDRGKDHEAIAAIFCDSKSMHAALLAVGARPGRPMEYEDEYRSAFGTTIKIQFQYKGKDGKILTEDAKSWVREFESKKPLKNDWVFGGSFIYVDPETKNSYYLADNGEMVCVSNFSTAMLDLPVESSQQNGDLVYQANPEKVPAKQTPIRMILSPDLKTVAAVEKKLAALKAAQEDLPPMPKINRNQDGE